MSGANGLNVGRLSWPWWRVSFVVLAFGRLGIAWAIAVAAAFALGVIAQRV